MTRHRIAPYGIIVLSLGLAACAGRAPAAQNVNTPVPNIPPAATRAAASPTQQVAASSTPAAPAATPIAAQALAESEAPADLTRTDSQGAVEFAVTPLNLTQPGDTLDFDVSMNTHSVNLAWNLAAQSRLTTDTGREAVGQSWPEGGGHHVDGTLTFPIKAADGTPLLAGAKKLTLTIQNAGAPERTFVWDLNP